MGTFLFNDDNGLSAVFAFVPNVPKIFGQYPEESARRGGADSFLK